MKTVRREPEAKIKNRLVEHYRLERLPCLAWLASGLMRLKCVQGIEYRAIGIPV